MNSQQILVDARQQLATAEANAAVARKEEARQKLAEVNAAGRQLKREYDELARQIQLHKSEVAAGQRDLAQFNNAITTHYAVRAQLEFPIDEDVAAWQDKLDQLVAARNKVLEALNRLHNSGPNLARALQLGHEIERLQYAARNLQGIIRGDRIDRWEGGVGPVS